MKRYNKENKKPDSVLKLFRAKFPKKKYRGKYQNLVISNNEIISIDTDNTEIIKFIKEKGLT